MSTLQTLEKIEYPESDGTPMGESDFHRDWMVRILDILQHRYAGQKVYVSANLFVYYEQGHPAKCVAPDVFVVLDCEPGRRRVFRTWEEDRKPDVVFEVTSESTKRTDIDADKKPRRLQEMGVREYFLYDPLGVSRSAAAGISACPRCVRTH